MIVGHVDGGDRQGHCCSESLRSLGIDEVLQCPLDGSTQRRVCTPDPGGCLLCIRIPGSQELEKLGIVVLRLVVENLVAKAAQIIDAVIAKELVDLRIGDPCIAPPFDHNVDVAYQRLRVVESSIEVAKSTSAGDCS